MNKVCVCIEGQLRGAAHCGPTIKKYLIDKLNADLYFVVQNYEKHNSDNFKQYIAQKSRDIVEKYIILLDESNPIVRPI